MKFNSTNPKFILLAGIATAALSSAASAQTTGESGASSATEFGDIIVTAQRRSESARDVPISLTALSGEQLASAGVVDTESLTNVTPGLKWDRIGNFTLPAIRGVTTFITGPAVDSNIAIYLDGVYQPASIGGSFDLPDVERIEVAKGPQGTLFGRNATGGAIQVFTKSPGYDLSGSATVSYGNFDDFKAKGYINVPIIADKAAISVAGYYNKSDSYYKRLTAAGLQSGLPGADTNLFRVKLLLEPTENLKILLSGSRADRRESNAIYGSVLNASTLSHLTEPTAIVATKPWTTSFNDVPFQESLSKTLSARVELDVGAGTITSVTGFVKHENYSPYDVTGAQTTDPTNQVRYVVGSTDKSFSQELTYASSSDGPFNFVIGAFYIKGSGKWTPLGVELPDFAGADIDIYDTQHYKAAAGFGELYYQATDRLKLIGGLRYSWEKRDLYGGVTLRGLPAPTLGFIGKKSWTSATPRVSAVYEVTPTANVYFTYSQGFKSGVFSMSAVSLNADGSLPLANPEKIKAYEVGFKGRVAEGLSINASMFYYDYSNVQLNSYKLVDLDNDPSTPAVPLAVLSNAAGARVYGAEIDAKWRLSDAFDMHFGISLLDPKYTSFPLAEANVPTENPFLPPGSGVYIGNTAVIIDGGGNTMLRAPKFTLTSTANYHADLAGGKLDLMGSVYYSTAVSYQFDGRVKQPSYATIDARIAWTDPSDTFTLAAYGRNLTDHAVISGAFISPSSDRLSYAPPRTYGVEATVRF